MQRCVCNRAFAQADAFFGSRVAPLIDITGNGMPEIRVKSYVESEFIDMIGGETLMHVFAGGDSEHAAAGEFLFAVVVTNEFDPWAPLVGDVTGDGSVTEADIDIILANWGLQGDELTSFDGDLNGDCLPAVAGCRRRPRLAHRAGASRRAAV